MSQFSGPQLKGAARARRKAKRREAIARNERTPRENRRWHREGRSGPGKAGTRA